MSAYRGRDGRFRKRDGLDVLEEIGACVLIILFLYTAFFALIP